MSVEDGSAERLTAALDQRLDGLLTEISRSDRPLVWVWAWPGSGVRRLVARLLDSSGETAALVGRRPAALPCEREFLGVDEMRDALTDWIATR